jgi:hypothetical protein
LNKRPRANTPSIHLFHSHSSTENSHSISDQHRKRRRKSPQLPQFRVYEDQILRADSPGSDAQNEPTPASIGPQMGRIWPHITVEIPFRPDSHSNSAISTVQRGPRRALGSLSSIALNGAQKAPQIPQNWLKNQPNDHTSKFFCCFLLFFVSILFFYIIFN